MGMQLHFETSIITNNQEIRLPKTNTFKLIKNNYYLFPIESNNLPVKRSENGDVFAYATVKSITFRHNQTEIIYELKKLARTYH